MREFILEIRIIQNFILNFLFYLENFLSIVNTVAQWQHFDLHVRGPQINPPSGRTYHFCTLSYLFRPSQVQILVQKAIFQRSSAVMGPMAKVFPLNLGQNVIGVKWRKVEEICLILEKDVFYLIQKRGILIFSKMARSKSKIF